MKKINRIIIAVLIAVFIFSSCVALSSISNVYAEELQGEIKAGQIVSIPNVNGKHTCEKYFTPDKDGDYYVCIDAKGLEQCEALAIVAEDGKYAKTESYEQKTEYRFFRKCIGLKSGVKYRITCAFYAKEGSEVTLIYDEVKNHLLFSELYSIKDKATLTSISSISFPYTGKSFDMEGYELQYSILENGYTKTLAYEYGKDYKITQYTTMKNYDNTALSGSLVWKDGSPSEIGDYVVRIEGLGNIRGYKDVRVHIENDFDFEYADVNEFEVTSKNVEMKRGGTVVYAIRPKTSGKYVVVINSEEQSCYIHGTIYDSWGNHVKQALLVDMNFFSGSITTTGSYVTLEAGKTYYLCVEDYVDYNKAEYETVKFQITILGEESVYVYKDPNAPEIDKEDKKTDEKTKDQKSDVKKQDSTTVQATTSASAEQTEKAVALAKGKKFTVKNITYKVTSSKEGNYQVSITSCKNKKTKSVTILDTVKYKGVSYKVTGVGANAFKNMSSLKNITIKSTKLTKVGANAFRGINKNATIKVPKAKKKAYTKLLKGKGQAKTVKIK